MIANDLSYLAGKHGMLPDHQFRDRPGRNILDAIHTVVSTVKDVWRSKKVVVALFLDIQSAFPNVVYKKLIHCLRQCVVLKCYMRIISQMLTNRQTRLHFDGWISDLMDVINSTTQGCPLLMILYVFYNAGLIKIVWAKEKDKKSVRFVDNLMLIAIAETLHQCHNIICKLME